MLLHGREVYGVILIVSVKSPQSKAVAEQY